MYQMANHYISQIAPLIQREGKAYLSQCAAMRLRLEHSRIRLVHDRLGPRAGGRGQRLGFACVTLRLGANSSEI